MSTVISETWSDSQLNENTDYGNDIDDAVNSVAVAVRERERNGGRVWGESNAAASGANYVTGDCYTITGGNLWGVLNNALSADLFTISDSLIRNRIAAQFDNAVTFNKDVTLKDDIITASGSTATIGDGTGGGAVAPFLYVLSGITSTSGSSGTFCVKHGSSTAFAVYKQFVNFCHYVTIGDCSAAGGTPYLSIGSNTASSTAGWLKLANRYGVLHSLWVDSAGKLRIVSGEPSSDTSGNVVGTYS